jgi:hypothetical protein
LRVPPAEGLFITAVYLYDRLSMPVGSGYEESELDREAGIIALVMMIFVRNHLPPGSMD